jgi:hypothetical protein
MPKFVVGALAAVLILTGAAPAINVEATVKKVDADQRLLVFNAEQEERVVHEEPWEELPNGALGRLAGFNGVGGVKIAGYVRKPAGPGPFPMVIILHGGGPTAKATSGETDEERAKNAADEASRAGKVLGRRPIRPLRIFSLRDGRSIRLITAPIPATRSTLSNGKIRSSRSTRRARFPSWIPGEWR